MTNPVQPNLDLFARLTIEVGKPIDIVNTPFGDRKSVLILGGKIEGKLCGKILPGGADNLIIRADGCAELDARYVIETEDGATIFVHDNGYRHGPKDIMRQLSLGEPVNPNDYYFRTIMRFQTGHEHYQHLNKQLFIGSGARTKKNVVIDLYAVQ